MVVERVDSVEIERSAVTKSLFFPVSAVETVGRTAPGVGKRSGENSRVRSPQDLSTANSSMSPGNEQRGSE